MNFTKKVGTRLCFTLNSLFSVCYLPVGTCNSLYFFPTYGYRYLPTYLLYRKEAKKKSQGIGRRKRRVEDKKKGKEESRKKGGEKEGLRIREGKKKSRDLRNEKKKV